MELPGSDIVRQGLEDLGRKKITVESLLVSIGAARLARGGIAVPEPLDDSEHRLYLLLRGLFSDGAHSKYNSYIRRLISFERALECGTSRA